MFLSSVFDKFPIFIYLYPISTDKNPIFGMT